MHASHLLGVALALAASAPTLSAQSPELAPLPADRRDGAAAIAIAEMRAWLATLTSRELGGRATGTEGYRLAAELVAEHFRAIGLEPGATDGFWQVLPWEVRRPTPDETFVRVMRNGATLVSFDTTNGLHGSLSVDGESSGPAVVAVCERPDGSDLAGLGLAGKQVVVVARSGLADGNARDRTDENVMRFSALRNYHRVRRAVDNAEGELVAVVDDSSWAAFGPIEARSTPGRATAGPAGAARGRSPAVALLRGDDLQRILAATGKSLAPAIPSVVDLDAEIESRTRLSTEQAPAYNVLAALRGSDAKLAEEWVLIGCHLDHLGSNAGGFYPGADDDGSGTVALMAIAKAFATNPTRPRRSVMFVAFAGEELGLLGSMYFTQNPTIPLDKVVAELQLDMIGRSADGGGRRASENGNAVYLVGSDKLSFDLHRVCVGLNETRAGFDLNLENVQDVFSRSDHFNFAKLGIPVAFFFTGFHDDYHRTTDTADKIEFDKLARIASWVYDIAFELAQRDERPFVDAERWAALAGKARGEPLAPTRR